MSRRNIIRHRRGSEIVEAALILPILLLLAFGTVEFGYYFHVTHNIQGAAREGARASIPPGATTDDVVTAVDNIMFAAGFEVEDYTVTVDPEEVEDAVPGDNVEVTVECFWEDVGVRPMSMISSGVEGQKKLVQGHAVMRKEEN